MSKKMSLFVLGIYPINIIFSYLEYKKRLQICLRSNKLLKILYIKKAAFKLYNHLINSFKKYNISSSNLQNLYDKIFEIYKNELEKEDINKIFSYFLQSLDNNFMKNGPAKLNPLFKYYNEFLGIEYISEYELKLVSLYEIEKNNVLKNEKITSLNINCTVSSSMEKEIPIIQKNLNYLLSLNKYKNIEIIIISEGFFTQDSFDCINLEKLQKLQLSFLELSSNDIINFFTKISDSHQVYPLISLDLSSNNIDDKCVDLLCWVTEINFPELQKINIHGNNFTSNGAEKILQKFHKYKKIDIALNKIGDEEIKLFRKYNKTSKKLKIFSQHRFSIKYDFKDNTLEEFYEKFNNLKEIELFEGKSYSKDKDGFIDNQIKNISYCLNKMKKIKNIEFTDSYKAGKILEKCENSFLEQIKDYRLAYCKITNKCIEITKKMKNLEELSCFHSSLLDKSFLTLSNICLSKIKKFSLYHCNLNQNCTIPLINLIINMKNLLCFNIDENEIGINSIIQIIKCLSENCHDLTVLDISKTLKPHKEGLNKLWDILINIYNLKKFYCQDNYINAKDMILFKNKLLDNFIMLNMIDFSYNVDIDAKILNGFLPYVKKYLNHVEVLSFLGVGISTEEELIKFRGIFPGRIKIKKVRNFRKYIL